MHSTKQHWWKSVGFISVALVTVAVVTGVSYAINVGLATAEPENATLAGSVTSVTDASASGGKAIRFGTASSGGFQANCINVPSACGYPDATNTGVPAGTTLTNQSGVIYASTNGQVISGINLNGRIIIQANNVTIKNSRITSSDYYPIDNNNGNTGLVVQDTEIIGTNSNVTAGLSFDNYTALRLNVSGAADGLKANTNVLIQDCYVHDLAVGTDTHNDGVQTTGGNNVKVIHNTFKLSMGNVSSVIQMGEEYGPFTNWLVQNNLMDGGGWSINAGQAAGSTIVVDGNRFTRNAGYGPGQSGNMIWTNNIYDDNGAPA